MVTAQKLKKSGNLILCAVGDACLLSFISLKVSIFRIINTCTLFYDTKYNSQKTADISDFWQNLKFFNYFEIAASTAFSFIIISIYLGFEMF